MWINSPPYPFVPAAQDLTSASSLCSQFAQSVGWSGKPSPSSTWLRRWKRVAWIKRLFGRTCEPSMAGRGVESWIASLRGIHARPSVSPASVVDKTILDTFGPTSIESLAKWNRQSCFSKMCPATCHLDSSRSPATLKTWVTKLRRDSLARKKLVLARNGNGSSLWLSPKGSQGGPDNRAPRPSGGTGNLKSQTVTATRKLWSTIRASDGEKGGPNQSFGAGGIPLPTQAVKVTRRLWATPRAEEGNQYNSQDKYVALSRQAPKMVRELFSLPDPMRQMPGCRSLTAPRSTHLQLNPRFVVWLMGWPRPTGSGFSATEWSHFKRRMRSALYGLL